MDIEKFQEVKTTGGKMLNKVKRQKIYTLDYVKKYLAGKTKDGKKLNQFMKEELFTLDNIDIIVKVITHFAFRNGPVKDMDLSQEDMKLLNKSMHNRLAYIFTLIVEDRWIEINYILNDLMKINTKWDESEPDDQGYTERYLNCFTKIMNTSEK